MVGEKEIRTRRIGVLISFLPVVLAGCMLDPAILRQIMGGSPPPGMAGTPTPVPTASIPVPIPIPTSPVTATNLKGKWVFGFRHEPPPGPVLDCYPDTWYLSQTGDALHADFHSWSFFEEESSGKNESGTVTLSGFTNYDPDASIIDATYSVTYSLVFNPTSQHLVGTRNGKPFWAAPFIKKPAGGCAGVPIP